MTSSFPVGSTVKTGGNLPAKGWGRRDSTCRSSSGRDGCGKKRWCCKTPAKEEEEICWPSEG